MIWLILSTLPMALGLLYLTVRAPFVIVVLLAAAALTAAFYGLVVLGCYGAWEMGWFEHCGNFWESYDCHR